MKIYPIAYVVLAGLLIAVQPAMAADVCLRVHDIKETTPSKDGRSITFAMQDGKVWRNDLQGRCPDLWFNGFSWKIYEGEVCDSEAALTVLRSGEVCNLGKFTSVAPSQSKAPG